MVQYFQKNQFKLHLKVLGQPGNWLKALLGFSVICTNVCVLICTMIGSALEQFFILYKIKYS